jgi:hypothetical protein
MVRRGEARQRRIGKARRGRVRPGWAGHGNAGTARLGAARTGLARHGNAGKLVEVKKPHPS